MEAIKRKRENRTVLGRTKPTKRREIEELPLGRNKRKDKGGGEAKNETRYQKLPKKETDLG